jgi:hypothetical protein
MGSQDRGSTKTGDAGTDYDYFLLGWKSICWRWFLLLWTHNLMDIDVSRVFRV